MGPPAKKRKVEEPAMTTGSNAGSDTNSLDNNNATSSNMAALDKTLDHFMDSLEDARQAGGCLLDLKAVQRRCLSQLAVLQDKVEQRRTAVKDQSTTLASLEYEQGHWTTRIAELEASSRTPHLEALCREELEDDSPLKNASAEQVMAHYFGSSNTTNAARMTVLHHEIHQRGTLERDVAQTQKELTTLAGIAKKRSQFLHQLPDKLKDIEKASAPLQRWFSAQQQSQQGDTSGEGVPATGLSQHTTHTSSEREARLQLARTLPGPLYTLLVQLQSYVDDYPHHQLALEIVPSSRIFGSSTASGSSSSIWKHPPSSQCVMWQIPVPSVSATGSTTSISSNKSLSIGFAYHKEHHIVTAKILKTVGIDDKLMDLPTSVLQLNPNDTGEYSVVDPEQGSGDAAEEATATPYGKPYLWCNYLAGLQLMQGHHPHEQMTASTRVIVATMLRQIKANATLTYILHKVLPSHPRASALPPVAANNNAASQCLVKVSSFQLDKDATAATTTDANSQTKIYKILCKRGNHSLQASVRITASQYPVVTPPQWSLTGNTLQWGQDHGSQDALLDTTTSGDTAPPLHQSRLAALEARVNDMDGLVEQMRKEQTQEETTTTNDESYYYDWILTHQLREILFEWDAWVSSGGDNGNNEGGGGIGGGRSVRGRDRAKVE